MKYNLYTIKDEITGELSNPFPMRNDKELMRVAKIMANSPEQNYLNENIGDKVILAIGTWNNETGELTNAIRQIARGNDLVEVKNGKK